MKTKTYLTIDELIEYIENKNIIINNKEKAKEILKQCIF